MKGIEIRDYYLKKLIIHNSKPCNNSNKINVNKGLKNHDLTI